jgi:hypothetical protein
MKKSKFTEDQIQFALKLAFTGVRLTLAPARRR